MDSSLEADRHGRRDFRGLPLPLPVGYNSVPGAPHDYPVGGKSMPEATPGKLLMRSWTPC